MCTLTVIPTAKHVIITSNRDEHISRADTKFPVTKTSANGQIYFPQDPLAGGTWLAADDNGSVSVLLNGAFKKHSHRPPYRLSRGIVLLDSFDFRHLKDFTQTYNFDDIEPFTLVRINMSAQTISELRWDGNYTHYKALPFDRPHIWSSSTLYAKEVRDQRKKWFDEWITDSNLQPNQMLDFHKFGGTDIANSITMNRGNGLQTVSISQIIGAPKKMLFSHHNLTTNDHEQITISLPK